MSDVIIDGTTYSGSPTNTSNPQRPVTITRKRLKFGTALRAANGALNYVHAGFKFAWEIDWGDKANATTRTAVLALRDKTATFSYTDIDGTAYTVLNSSEDDYEEGITSNRSNAYLYALKIVLQES